jgi:Protein of unknown function (DUF2934)
MIGDQELIIRERAHGIWEREGRPEGRAVVHWQMAAAELAAESGASAPAKARKKAAARPAAAARATQPKRSRKATD